MTDTTVTAVPFAFFVSLLKAISSIKPVNSRKSKTPSYKESVLRTLNNWIAELRRRYSPITSDIPVAFFRLFFPEEDVSRKYSLQEAKLALYLSEILSASRSPHCSGGPLQDWRDANSHGCLGAQVLTVVNATSPTEDDAVSLAQVDLLLSELASTSAFSASSIRSPTGRHRSPRVILQHLYANMGPFSAAFLTQIILKDLRPLLYPLSETHYTISLLQFNSAAVYMLTKEDAMKAWDPTGKMLRIYRLRASLEEAARAYEGGDALMQPKIGIPIEIPKCLKGQSCSQALKTLRAAKRVWVETKYDGERAQIHVQLNEHGKPHITIFSKSKRDSTLDRVAVHPIILEALGIPKEGCSYAPRSSPSINTDVILEAEMVAYSDEKEEIDEFWRIRSLVASTAYGARHKQVNTTVRTSESQLVGISQTSLVSNASDGGTRHLALVFFDILLLDSISLLHRPYAERRAILERTVRLHPGYAMLAERTAVDTAGLGVQRLEQAFAGLLADHQEGAVLKAEESRYCDWTLRWVKLKADYIPGYGDCVDLALLGAGWDKHRARELRVSPSVYTTFYFGALSNRENIVAHPTAKPHFTGLLAVSYGLDRAKLEELNFLIKSSDPIECAANKKQPLPTMPFTVDIPPGLPRPPVFLQTPLLGELYGAGFTKAPQRTFYELRFPRLSKVYRTRERSWTESASIADLQQIAREAIGKDRPGKDVEDWCNELWGVPASPGIRSTVKRKEREEEWVGSLTHADGKGSSAKARRLSVAAGAKRTSDREESENARAGERATAKSSSSKSKALGLVTNVLADEITDVARVHRLRVNKTPRSPVSPLKMPVKDQRATSPSPSGSLLQSVVANLIASSHLRPDEDLGASSFIPDIPPAAQNLRYASTPLGIFLSTAVVWLVRPTGSPRPAWRVPSSHIIPHGHQVHSLDALLLGCECAWAKCGVIFVNEGEEIVLERLRERWGKGRGKPVFVLGFGELSIEKVSAEGDVEKRAICRVG